MRLVEYLFADPGDPPQPDYGDNSHMAVTRGEDGLSGIAEVPHAYGMGDPIAPLDGGFYNLPSPFTQADAIYYRHILSGTVDESLDEALMADSGKSKVPGLLFKQKKEYPGYVFRVEHERTGLAVWSSDNNHLPGHASTVKHIRKAIAAANAHFAKFDWDKESADLDLRAAQRHAFAFSKKFTVVPIPQSISSVLVIESLDEAACGQCFEWAYQQFMRSKGKGVTLHHGTVVWLGESQRKDHAWIVRGGRIFDWQMMEAGFGGKFHRKGYPKDVFEELFQPKRVKMYKTDIDAIHAQGSANKRGQGFHYGPWESIDEGWTRKKLIAAAEASPKHTVEHRSQGVIDIKKGKRGVGVTLYSDGTAVRNDVDLTVTTNIRSVREVARLLDLREVLDEVLKRGVNVDSAEDRKVIGQLEGDQFPSRAEDGKGFCFHWADGRGVCGFTKKSDALCWLKESPRDVVKFWYGEPVLGNKKRRFKLSGNYTPKTDEGKKLEHGSYDTRAIGKLKSGKFPGRAEDGKGFCFVCANGAIHAFKWRGDALRWAQDQPRDIKKFWYGEPISPSGKFRVRVKDRYHKEDESVETFTDLLERRVEEEITYKKVHGTGTTVSTAGRETKHPAVWGFFQGGKLLGTILGSNRGYRGGTEWEVTNNNRPISPPFNKLADAKKWIESQVRPWKPSRIVGTRLTGEAVETFSALLERRAEAMA